MTGSAANFRAFTDAVSDAVAREIAALRRDAQREREAFAAETRAARAEWEARLASVSEIERRLADRLATLKDGERGADGRDGCDGVDGAPGEQGPRGRDGRDGADGAPGEPGAPGADGRDGVDGRDGAPGLNGRDGIDGVDGKDGKDGVKGADGRDGIDGAPGRNGEPGERGAEGAPGKLRAVSQWIDAVHYEGDVVTFEGRTFQAKRDTGKPPAHDDWICIAERGLDGRAGADGANGENGHSLRIRGTWLEINDYRELDIVALNGASFVARRDDPGPCPGDGWQLMASQGKQGRPGERGVGLRGERGLPGEGVAGLTVNDEGLLTVVNGDGSTVTVDLYPLINKAQQ